MIISGDAFAGSIYLYYYYSLFTNDMQWFSVVLGIGLKSESIIGECSITISSAKLQYSGFSTFREIYRKPLHKISELTVVFSFLRFPNIAKSCVYSGFSFQVTG